MYERPRNDYPPALVARQDHLPDNRPCLKKIDFFVDEIKYENKRSLLAGEVIGISRSANPNVAHSYYMGKKSILRLPFNSDAARGYVKQVMTLSDAFAFDSSARYQLFEPLDTVLNQTAVFVKDANYVYEKSATLIEGTIVGAGRKCSVVGKMTEGRNVRFTSFIPVDRIYSGQTLFMDHLLVSFRATDSECTLHGVDMRPREDVPFTPENIASIYAATHRAADASRSAAPPKTGEGGPT